MQIAPTGSLLTWGAPCMRRPPFDGTSLVQCLEISPGCMNCNGIGMQKHLRRKDSTELISIA